VTADPPVVPSAVYGLRTWTVAGERGSERLAGPHRGVPWPTGGEWLDATCELGHAAPAGGCQCGVHAWHPRRRTPRAAADPIRHPNSASELQTERLQTEGASNSEGAA